MKTTSVRNLKQQIEDLVSDIETLIANLAPDTSKTHLCNEKRVRRFANTALQREFQRSVARRDFAAARSILRQMTHDDGSPSPIRATCGY